LSEQQSRDLGGLIGEKGIWVAKRAERGIFFELNLGAKRMGLSLLEKGGFHWLKLSSQIMSSSGVVSDKREGEKWLKEGKLQVVNRQSTS